MAQIIHNISTPNDGLGDELRTAMDNQNQMNTELYTTKVDKEIGKGLSTNDYTNAEKSKLAGIEQGAEVNVQSDWLQNDDTADDYIKNKPEQLFSSIGHFHYADLATQTTPLSVIANVPKKLTNDTLGSFTNIDFAPYAVPSVWDKTLNSFIFSFLDLGDQALIRIDIDLTTTSTNQKVDLYIKFGKGTPSEYDLLIDSFIVKTVVTDMHIAKEVSFSIDNEDWQNAEAEVYILSDDNASVKVNGWYVPIIRKSVNVIDIEGGATWGTITGTLSEQTDLQNALDSKLDKTTTPLSVYGTDGSGGQTMIPLSELKDVLEFANLAAFPATGETGKIYVALDTNFTYRWSGSAYVKIGGATPETLLQNKGYAIDFCSANNIGSAPEMPNINIASGTVDYTKSTISTLETGHVGIVALKSSTSANSGYSFFKGAIINNGDNHTCFIQFKIISNTNTKGYLGFHASTSTATPTNASWLEIVNGTAQFKTRNASTETASPTFSLLENVWYSMMIEFISMTEIIYKIKTDDGTLVYQWSPTSNFPAYNVSVFTCAVTFFSTSATTARELIWLDYVEYRTAKPNHLKLF